MEWKMKKQMKKGFTLVEMMIVVAIIAVLAGVAVPQYNKYVKKSNTTEALRFMKQIVDAEILEESQKGSYLAMETTADGNSAAELKLGFEVPDTGTFKKYKVQVCNGTNKGIIVTATTGADFTGAGTKVYMIYPSNVTLTNTNGKDNYDGTSFINDFVNGVDTTADVPTCD
jgi:prepilin-type N-terminal cleavage/methylation domain-containing protein